ncbi:GlsB/YeaQ/YmgE family stress response membrane protein [Rubrobacter calidifluminis]|uniref:GlsB/YeaQ/YmgE family stress response membrane protein n=1 Tax=Rubrobacter calidifluminis TaxID=1392640 RepID=UPI00235E23FB|nr:GlsB/YeaQ/YmgE family stress response membrane protein [Rubrobacter calidifluminis]
MSIVAWIVFGFIVGVIAKLLTPGRDPGGCILTTLIGIAGAIIGGYAYSHFINPAYTTRFDTGSIAVSVLGAIFLLVLYRLLSGRRL